MIYYEEERVEDLVTFAASKNLNALLKVNCSNTYYSAYEITFHSMSRKNTAMLKLISVLSFVLNHLVISLN